MTPLRLIGVGAILTALGTTSALAQATVMEPGFCAFYYPYANCQNKGAGNPFTDPNYPRGPQVTGGSSGDPGLGPIPSRHARKRPAM